MAKNNFKKKSSEELKQEFEALTEKLYQGVTDYLKSDKYQEILDNISKFRNYSVNNTMLIMLQKPSATYCSSFTDWKKKFNRKINPRERGIKIYMPTTFKVNVMRDKLDDNTHLPMVDEDGNTIKEIKQIDRRGFKVGYVYDYSQTSQIEGKPEIDIQITKELTGDIDDKLLLKAIKQSSDVPIHYEDIPGMAKGYFSDDKQLIVIKNGLSEKQETKTILHEIAHSIVDNSKADNLRKEMNIELSDEVKREESEIIAESTAYLVSNNYGLNCDEYSFPYIASWSRENPKVILACLDTIKKTANEIIRRIDLNLESLRYEFQPELQEKTMKINDYKVFIQLNSDNDFDYAVFDPDGEEMDGGVLENTESLGYIPNKVFDEISQMHNLNNHINKNVYYAYVYNDQGFHNGKIPIEASFENIASLFYSTNNQVTITDVNDNFIASSLGTFLDRVADTQTREGILRYLTNYQMGDSEPNNINYIIETPELNELAYELEEFVKDYDFYSYQDANDYPNKVYDDIVSSLRKGGKELEGIREFLIECKTESDNGQEIVQADLLLAKIDKFERSNIRMEIKENTKIQHKLRMA